MDGTKQQKAAGENIASIVHTEAIATTVYFSINTAVFILLAKCCLLFITSTIFGVVAVLVNGSPKRSIIYGETWC